MSRSWRSWSCMKREVGPIDRRVGVVELEWKFEGEEGMISNSGTAHGLLKIENLQVLFVTFAFKLTKSSISTLIFSSFPSLSTPPILSSRSRSLLLRTSTIPSLRFISLNPVTSPFLSGVLNSLQLAFSFPIKCSLYQNLFLAMASSFGESLILDTTN